MYYAIEISSPPTPPRCTNLCVSYIFTSTATVRVSCGPRCDFMYEDGEEGKEVLCGRMVVVVFVVVGVSWGES